MQNCLIENSINNMALLIIFNTNITFKIKIAKNLYFAKYLM